MSAAIWWRTRGRRRSCTQTVQLSLIGLNSCPGIPATRVWEKGPGCKEHDDGCLGVLSGKIPFLSNPAAFLSGVGCRGDDLSVTSENAQKYHSRVCRILIYPALSRYPLTQPFAQFCRIYIRDYLPPLGGTGGFHYQCSLNIHDCIQTLTICSSRFIISKYVRELIMISK